MIPDAVMIEPKRFEELNRDNVPLAEVEFIGEANPDFGAEIANNLRHVTTDNHGRRYRLVKMILEEVV
jgi:hypothetical protein